MEKRVNKWLKGQRQRFLKTGSQEKKTEKHETKSQLEYVMEETHPITKTTSVQSTAEKMLDKGKKRIPVADPGTKKLKGDIRALDILDLFGGGEKTDIVESKFKGNIAEALNLKIRKIKNDKTLQKDVKTPLSEVMDELRKTHVDTVYITEEGKAVGEIGEKKLINLISSAEGKKKVKDTMTKDPVTAGPGYKVSDASRVMVKNNFNRLPVISKHELKGMVTYIDLLEYFSEEMFEITPTTMEHEVFKVIIENIMTEDLVTVSPDDTLHDASKKMKETGHGGLPVTEDNSLKGIITRRDIIKVIK